MKPVVKYVITDVHMGSQHDGLDEIIKLHKRRNQLFAKAIKTPGSLVMFLNTGRTRMKLFREGGEVIGYYRTRSGGKITQNSVDAIPAEFGGSVEYSTAAKSALKKFLEMEQESEALEA